MDVSLLVRFFGWSTIFNLCLLFLIGLLWVVASDLIYRVHSRWFPMKREVFNIIFYVFIGVYKILLFVFNLIPWIVLMIIN